MKSQGDPSGLGGFVSKEWAEAQAVYYNVTMAHKIGHEMIIKVFGCDHLSTFDCGLRMGRR